MLSYLLLGVVGVSSIFCYKYQSRLTALWRILKSINNSSINRSQCVINDKIANIKYNYQNIDYNIYLPYDKNHAISMIEFKVELINKDGTIINITHQAGIPYLVSAEMLGGCNIRIINEDNGKVHNYGDKTSPYYGIEVMQ